MSVKKRKPRKSDRAHYDMQNRSLQPRMDSEEQGYRIAEDGKADGHLVHPFSGFACARIQSDGKVEHPTASSPNRSISNASTRRYLQDNVHRITLVNVHSKWHNLRSSSRFCRMLAPDFGALLRWSEWLRSLFPILTAMIWGQPPFRGEMFSKSQPSDRSASGRISMVSSGSAPILA